MAKLGGGTPKTIRSRRCAQRAPWRSKPATSNTQPIDAFCAVIRSGLVQRLANTSRTVSATFSAVNPKYLNNAGADADSP